MESTTIFRLRFNRNYTTFVKTGRGHVKVDFTPIVMFGRTENSQFGTADTEVIDALKKHEHYGSLFFIEEAGRDLTANHPAAVAPTAAGQPSPTDGVGSDDDYVAVEGKDISDPVEAASAEIPGPGEEGANGGSDDNQVVQDTLTHEKSVTSKNKAIAYLMEKFGAKFSQTTDIAAMKEEALNVYNVVFDNWK